MKTKVDQIQRKHVVAMKPNLKNLALFEAYSDSQNSNSEYTKAIGLVNRIYQLPFQQHYRVKAAFAPKGTNVTQRANLA